MENSSEKNERELVEELSSLKTQLLDARMKKSSGQLARPHILADLRKQIARICTFLNKKLANPGINRNN